MLIILKYPTKCFQIKWAQQHVISYNYFKSRECQFGGIKTIPKFRYLFQWTGFVYIHLCLPLISRLVQALIPLVAFTRMICLFKEKNGSCLFLVTIMRYHQIVRKCFIFWHKFDQSNVTEWYLQNDIPRHLRMLKPLTR